MLLRFKSLSGQDSIARFLEPKDQSLPFVLLNSHILQLDTLRCIPQR